MRKNAAFPGKSERPEFLALKYARRRGLIAGATGAGKAAFKTAARTLARERARGAPASLKRR